MVHKENYLPEHQSPRKKFCVICKCYTKTFFAASHFLISGSFSFLCQIFIKNCFDNALIMKWSYNKKNCNERPLYQNYSFTKHSYIEWGTLQKDQIINEILTLYYFDLD